nr:retrovirus-related Pol polyprotein from transposon TNT 1-94 [Tanacetum cinerariifolium]GEX22585.1 retrovirus-related Pol polyprotein from transposon TNT 1-94 [Tanacetum cinerariifolium]
MRFSLDEKLKTNYNPDLKSVFSSRTGSKIDLEEIQESVDEEPIINTNTQQKVVTLVEPDDISLPIRRTSSSMDVKTVFLNGKLTEDVFMAQSEGFKNENEDESCVYVKVSGSVVVFLVLYVDDILLIRNDIPTLQSVKDWLGKCFAIKDLEDATYTLDKDDSRSRSGWVFLLNGGVVTWKSLKKDTVADSTCESEYITACEASKEAIWMKNFIGDLGVVPTVQDPIEIFRDNESAVALTKELKDHGKSKHIERKYHFVRSKVEEGHMIVKDIRSEDNPVDPFTKALAKSKHDEHAKSIGLRDKIDF